MGCFWLLMNHFVGCCFVPFPPKKMVLMEKGDETKMIQFKKLKTKKAKNFAKKNGWNSL